jgi:hypothetical protein
MQHPVRLGLPPLYAYVERKSVIGREVEYWLKGRQWSDGADVCACEISERLADGGPSLAHRVCFPGLVIARWTGRD